MPRRTRRTGKPWSASCTQPGSRPARSRPGHASWRPRAPARRGPQAGRLQQRGIATAMGVSVARVSQIEHGKVASFEVIAR
jgi:transcriptional regulator with XRE-family HTH domain